MAVAADSAPRTPDRIVRDAAGIGLAVGVYAVSFGVLAVAAGLSAAQACVMSMLVFTGASQFAFVGVLAGGGGALAAFGPAVVLAARNAAYGLSLAPILRGRLPRRALAGAARDRRDDGDGPRAGRPGGGAARVLATGISVWVCWNLGTLIGARRSAAASATRGRSGSTRCSRPRSSRCSRRSCGARARRWPRSPAR